MSNLDTLTSAIARWTSSGRLWRVTFIALMAFGSGVFFFAMSWRVLSVAHPADDAYILFRYVQNAAAGLGIVCNAGGARTEGATDFLWLVLLIGAVRRGADVALAAATLNAVGAALAAWLLSRLCWGDADRPRWARAVLCAVLPAGVLTGGALAGYFAFSSMLYSALTLLLFAVALEARGRALVAIPVLGLTLALFRPDGVIVGTAFVVIGLWPASSTRLLGRYLAASAGCAGIGLLYFAWRWAYFGVLLPLPLVVKQHGSVGSVDADVDVGSLWSLLPGLGDHGRWLMDPQGPLLVIAGLAVLLAYGRLWRNTDIKRMLIFLLPLAGLVAVLAFAVQSQNVQWRFQAPVQLVLVYALLYAAGRAMKTKRGPVPRFLIVGLTVASVVPSWGSGLNDLRLHLRGQWNTYLEAFAPRFGPHMGGDSVVALTEAGILPYFTSAQVVDMVGLNNAETALRPRDVSYVRGLNPDMIFFHHAGTLENDALVGQTDNSSRVLEISPATLRRALRPSLRGLIQRRVETYPDSGLRTTEYAAVLLTQFLIDAAEDYEILSVDFKGNQDFVHVYGLKRDWPLRRQARETLYSSMEPENYLSYLSVRNE